MRTRRPDDHGVQDATAAGAGATARPEPDAGSGSVSGPGSDPASDARQDAPPGSERPDGRQQARVVAAFRAGHDELTAAFEALDGSATFRETRWRRPGGGGGTARVLEGGAVLERAGVNMSVVHGDAVPPSLVKQHPETAGHAFFATGVSLVLHPRNPFVPAFHANFRYFETREPRGAEGVGAWWFGGGADLTPSYPFEADARHFHGQLASLCARHDVADYPTWKDTCDRYFYLRHRGQMRGIGGIFFDRMAAGGALAFDAQLAFVEDGLASLKDAYLPIAQLRKDTAYGARQRDWQLHRRGRYVEFNLVYDRGTLFGLQTDGNIEAILMSMPPLASWSFDKQPEPGSPEADALAYFQPRDWLGSGPPSPDEDASRARAHAAPGDGGVPSPADDPERT